MESNFDIDPILLKYVREEALTPEEETLLHDWVRAGEGRAELLDRLRNDPEFAQTNLARMQQTSTSRIWETLSSRIEQDSSVNRIWNQVESMVQADGYWQDETASSPVVPLSHP